jgi:hypothetical protein
MNNNMPNIPVHDLVVHPRDNDLVLASYGRGVWVTNVSALQQLTPAVLASDVHLFTSDPGVQRIHWSFGANDYFFAQRHFLTPNAPSGLAIRYYLKNATAARPVVTVKNAAGQEVARLQGSGDAGINTVMWGMRVGAGRGAGPGVGGGGGARGGGAAAGTNILDQWVPLGEYTVTIDAGERTLTGKVTVAKTIGWTIGTVPQTIR